MPSPQEIDNRLRAIERLDLLTVVRTLLANLLEQGLPEKDPIFLASPAAAIDWRDIKIIRSTPDMLREVAKIPEGKKGDAGYSPVKGVDYFTQEETAAFLKAVTPVKGIHFHDGVSVKGDKGDQGDPGKDATNASLIPRVVKIAEQEVKDHEERFRHDLLHDKFIVGSYEVDESDAAPGKMLVLNTEGTKLVYKEVPKPTRTDSNEEHLWGAGLQGLTFSTRETPSGNVNDSNATFTLAHTPVVGSEQVYVNGILLDLTNDYTISGSTITLVTTPSTNAETSGVPDKVRVSYRY